MTSAAPVSRPLPSALRTEGRRTGWAMAITFVPAVTLVSIVEGGPQNGQFAIVVLWYGLYLLAYSAATVTTFQRDFDAACHEQIHSSGPWWRRWTGVGTRVENAVGWSAFALGAAAALAILGVSERSVLLTVGTVVLVVGAWVNVLVSYAAEYARAHRQHGGLDFPGEPPSGYQDYLYFAAAVSTTFGPTDVSVVTRRMRRQVLLHGIVAFVFNTVILALMISTLLG